jgi:hypothetical protein
MKNEGEELLNVFCSEKSSKVEFFTSPVPFNVHIGSLDMLKVLWFLQTEEANKECCFNTHNYYVVEYLWTSLYKKLVIMTLIDKILPLFILLCIHTFGTSFYGIFIVIAFV